MQVMVITKAVDVGPALQMPVDLVVDPAVFDIAHHGVIDAFAKPRQGRMFRSQQVAVQVTRSHIRPLSIQAHNFIR